jgi:dienelactone hydrolase
MKSSRHFKSPMRIAGRILLLLTPVTFFTGLLLIRCNGCDNRKPPARIVTSSGIPPVPDSLKRQMEHFQNWHFTTLVDRAPGGGIVVLRRGDETAQLYAVSAPGNALRRLTFLTEPVIDAWVCPDPDRKILLFTQDSGGDENFRICSLQLDSLRIIQLTHDSAQNDGVVWSNRGDRFAYSSNRRNNNDFDLYIRAIDHPADSTPIITNGGMWSAIDWSPGDRKLLVSHYVSSTSSRLHILDLANDTLFPMNDIGDTVSQDLGAWGPGGEGVFYTSDQNTDLRCLRYFNCMTGKEKTLTAGIKWDVRDIALSTDRRQLAFTTNENGFSQVYLMDAYSFTYRKITSLPPGIIGSLRFNRAGSSMAMTVTTPQQPEDVYELDLSTMAATRWTDSDPECRGRAISLQPDIIDYPTFDSCDGQPRRIPCLVYKPANRTAPFPVLITIHGGPETQYWPSFKPEILFYLSDLGIAVVAPNVRGSGGYGKEYLSLDNGLRREGAVRDIGACIDWIARQPAFDSTRIAVTGGSYGGFLALASMVHYNERLRAGIDCYGIGNFITFLENTASYRRDLRRVEYGDERDPLMRKFLAGISPLTRADRISKPLLIIQGANDPRVPLSESRQIADAVRKNGSIVWLLVAGDEGHGFRKKSNKDYQEQVTAMFLKEFLVR